MKKLSVDSSSGFKVIASTPRSQAATMVLAPGESTGGPYNQHASSDQWLYIVSGHGKAIISGKTIKIQSGELLLIEVGESHETINLGTKPLKTLSIYAPPEY